MNIAVDYVCTYKTFDERNFIFQRYCRVEGLTVCFTKKKKKKKENKYYFTSSTSYVLVLETSFGSLRSQLLQIMAFTKT